MSYIFSLPLLYCIFVLSLAGIFFTTLVVWRVERRLDASYKLMLSAIIAFTVGVGLQIISVFGINVYFWPRVAELVFVVLFLLSVKKMHALVKTLGDSHRR